MRLTSELVLRLKCLPCTNYLEKDFLFKAEPTAIALWFDKENQARICAVEWTVDGKNFVWDDENTLCPMCPVEIIRFKELP